VGKFPDYNDDGGVDTLDVQIAPADRKMEVFKIALADSFTGDVGDYARGEKQRADEMLMKESGALTANPMPSMPSISNVGAAPFSGSINWNAIPGGFQPLPQVAGGRKKLYQLSKFHGGMNEKSSPRDISDTECLSATNVTFSNIGRIKLLGDIKSTSSTLSSATLASSATHIPSPGYGLYVFKSGYSLASPTPVQGDYTIVVGTDGEHVVVNDGTTAKTDADTWLTIANEAIDVAPVFYASGNGLYACDANLIHTTTRKAAILVNRKDINDSLLVTGWQTGAALLTSPTVHASDTNSVELKASHGNAGDTGRLEVSIVNSGDGNWGATGGVVYTFYLSYLFDNGCETGLSYMGTGTFENENCVFNVSIQHTNTNPLGGDKRIHGARLYFREAGDVERFLLAEISLPDGVRGALDSTFVPWDNPTGTIYDLASDITFDSPPAVYTYVSLNGYYANEVYDKSPDSVVAPVPHSVRYRTATVGSNGAVFIGCFSFRGKTVKDGMMFSMANKPGVFPEYNVFDSPSSDGTPITALVSFQDKILQFKQDALYIVNISNPSQFYTEASFRNCGIMNPCQAFQTPFGVIFANYIGCFIYDGSKVISLTSGKFTIDNWGISEGSVVDTAESGSREKDAVNVPCVGYDPRSQSIIVLKNIGNNSTTTSAWIYHMGTQSWTEGASMIINTTNDNHTNFIISPNGYLSIQQDSEEALKTYNIGAASTQTIAYRTKDLDFGMPTQTKKIFKIYVTYLGDGSGVTVTYGADGDTTPAQALTNAENSGATLTSAGTTDHNVATFTLNSHPANLKSIMLKFTGTAATDFEINDISILYRARPIK